MSFRPPISLQTSINSLILLYHRVAEDPIDSQLLAVSNENFEEHLIHLKNNFRIISLDDMISELQSGSILANTVAITFDDGYLDNFENALPLLEKHRIPATIFVTAGMIDQDRAFWWDALEQIFLSGRKLPDILSFEHKKYGSKIYNTNTSEGRFQAWSDLCMILHDQSYKEIAELIHELAANWADYNTIADKKHEIMNSKQLKQISKSQFITIGSHTITHTTLGTLSAEKQQFELSESRKILENIIDEDIDIISYPFGSEEDFTDITKQLTIQAGYKSGIANIQSDIISPIDLFALPRRLVRNWTGTQFADWLKAGDKSLLERKTIEERNIKLNKL